MADFMLLLHEDPSAFAEMSPEDSQKIIEEYTAWQTQLETDGRLTGGNKLTDGEGRWMRKTEAQVRVLDGPFSEAKEIIGGYFSIRAESYEEAVEICQGCPHLNYGTIEIREIEH